MTGETMTTTTALPLAAGHWTLDPFHSAVMAFRSTTEPGPGHVRRHADT
ncbi:hypothetical protein [Nonomuraea dietziae]